MGRRFQGPSWLAQIEDVSYEEDENQEEDVKSTKAGGGNNQISKDEDYSEEQYPPENDKYKQLEDRLKAVEIQTVPSLEFGDLSLVPGVVIPH